MYLHVTDDPGIGFRSFRRNPGNGLKQQGVPGATIAKILGYEMPGSSRAATASRSDFRPCSRS